MTEIVDREDIDGTHLFTVCTTNGQKKEAILVRSDQGLKCWLNYCKHITTVKLQKSEKDSPTRDGEIVCRNHGAMFDLGSGICTFGPCEGAVLDPVEIEISDGSVYLTDDEYDYLYDGDIKGGDDLPNSTTGESEFL